MGNRAPAKMDVVLEDVCLRVFGIAPVFRRLRVIEEEAVLVPLNEFAHLLAEQPRLGVNGVENQHRVVRLVRDAPRLGGDHVGRLEETATEALNDVGDGLAELPLSLLRHPLPLRDVEIQPIGPEAAQFGAHLVDDERVFLRGLEEPRKTVGPPREDVRQWLMDARDKARKAAYGVIEQPRVFVDETAIERLLRRGERRKPCGALRGFNRLPESLRVRVGAQFSPNTSASCASGRANGTCPDAMSLSIALATSAGIWWCWTSIRPATKFKFV